MKAEDNLQFCQSDKLDILGEWKAMKLKNILIVVKDIEKSKQFYHDLFGLNTILNSDGNVIM